MTLSTVGHAQLSAQPRLPQPLVGLRRWGDTWRRWRSVPVAGPGSTTAGFLPDLYDARLRLMTERASLRHVIEQRYRYPAYPWYSRKQDVATPFRFRCVLLTYFDLKNFAARLPAARATMASIPWARSDRGHRVSHYKWSCAWRGSRCCRLSCCGCRRSWRGWMLCWMTRCSSRRSRRTSTRCSGGRPPRSRCYLRLMFLKFRYSAGL